LAVALFLDQRWDMHVEILERAACQNPVVYLRAAPA
jgi:hypothetical protein